jgi:DHA2 family multidrug resistance protein
MATSLTQIVAFRLLQGFAGAALMPLTQASMFDLWEPHVRPRVLAIWSSVIMVGPIIGPTIGGMLTEAYSWRWVFYINLPIGAVSFAAVYLCMPRGGGGAARRFDVLGFVALAVFTAAFQLVADRGSGQDWFDSREICIEAIVAGIALYVFVMQTMTARQPFLPRELWQDPNFVITTIVSFFISAVLFASSALLPTLMQTLFGYSAEQAGYALMPRGVGSLIGFAVAPAMVRRIGARAVTALGLMVCFWALWQMGHFDLAMTMMPVAVTGTALGFGVGLIFGPVSVMALATLDPAHRTEGAVAATVSRSLGGSLGIAMIQALLIRQSAAAHEGLAAHITLSDPLVRWSLPQLVGGGALEPLNREITRQGAMIGYDAVFGWTALASLGVLPLLLILRPSKSQPIEFHAGES